MPLLPLDALADLPAGARLLGLDLGTKTIGLALSDPGRAVGSPLVTLARGKSAADLAALRTLIAEHRVAGVILGLPLNLDGKDGPRAQATRAFARNLLAVVDLPLALWDERLSTAAIERALTNEADLSRARRAQLVDKLAAAYILQGALDFLRRRRPPL